APAPVAVADPAPAVAPVPVASPAAPPDASAPAPDPDAQANFRAGEIAQQNAAALIQDLLDRLTNAFDNAASTDPDSDRSGDVLTAGPGGAPTRVEISGTGWNPDFQLPDGTQVWKSATDPSN